MAGRRILVANRGEIALRVIRAIRELGDIPLTVYSKADRSSMHVSQAEEAYCVGEGPSNQSYLNMAKVIEAARAMEAEAIHPGYGFLSENASFVEALEKEGILFIGPSADHIHRMGNKVMARQTVEKTGMPLVPGTKDGLSDPDEAFEKAKTIGFPIMIKAIAGGGGRGMRLAEKESEFVSLFKRAFSEAEKAFGDGTCYLERYIGAPHHVEVQIIGDKHGNVCHLFERECSVQRRHQKVIEESPSPFISEETRRKICECATNTAKELGYVNAGTFEFLVDDDQSFYFMEMNTRLQVEHPITELVTGIDIVREQIEVAFGAELSFKQEEVTKSGHAMEFRICAEDPVRMLPQAGKLTGVKFPCGAGVRIDSHVYRGYEIPVFYDSMIAKISVWARNRKECIERSRAVLKDTVFNGVETIVPVHLQLLENELFLSGNYTTRLMADSFKYDDSAPKEDELHMAMMAVAVSAYQKEFLHLKPEEEENSRWKSTARVEALR